MQLIVFFRFISYLYSKGPYTTLFYFLKPVNKQDIQSAKRKLTQLINLIYNKKRKILVEKLKTNNGTTEGNNNQGLFQKFFNVVSKVTDYNRIVVFGKSSDFLRSGCWNY